MSIMALNSKAHRRLSLALFAVITLAATPAQSARIEGVQFADDLAVGDQMLVLRGTALLRYRVFFRGYVAALYLAPDASVAEVLGDVPRRLEIEYFWSIPGDGFVDATLDGIRRNTDDESFDRLRPRIDRFNTFYTTVEPGDRYELTYVPGQGTELALNGASLGRVEGADFARALFSIWVGAEPFDESLKAQLLGTETTR
jgi:hypothetical protein